MSGLSPERRERLLRVRRAGEGVEHGRWARARMEHAARLAETEGVAAKREAVADELRREERGTLDLARLQAAAACREALARDLDRTEAAARIAGREAEARRRALEDANRRVRAIEKLSERAGAEEAARGRAAESRELDDRRTGAVGL